MKISFQEYPPPENFFHIIVFIHNSPFSEGIYLCVHSDTLQTIPVDNLAHIISVRSGNLRPQHHFMIQQPLRDVHKKVGNHRLNITLAQNVLSE